MNLKPLLSDFLCLRLETVCVCVLHACVVSDYTTAWVKGRKIQWQLHFQSWVHINEGLKQARGLGLTSAFNDSFPSSKSLSSSLSLSPWLFLSPSLFLPHSFILPFFSFSVFGLSALLGTDFACRDIHTHTQIEHFKRHRGANTHTHTVIYTVAGSRGVCSTSWWWWAG